MTSFCSSAKKQKKKEKKKKKKKKKTMRKCLPGGAGGSQQNTALSNRKGIFGIKDLSQAKRKLGSRNTFFNTGAGFLIDLSQKQKGKSHSLLSRYLGVSIHIPNANNAQFFSLRFREMQSIEVSVAIISLKANLGFLILYLLFLSSPGGFSRHALSILVTHNQHKYVKSLLFFFY